MYRYFSIGLLLAAIVLVGILFYQVMAGFFLPLFLAALLVVIFQPFHDRLLRLFRGRKKLAAGVTTAAILLIVLLPLTLIAVFAAAESRSLVRHLDPVLVGQKMRELRARLQLDMPAAGQFDRMALAIRSMRSQELPPNTEKQRQQLLYDVAELKAYARELGQELQLTWPATGGSPDPPAARDRRTNAWLAFAGPLEKIASELAEPAWKQVHDPDQQQQLLATARDNFQAALTRFFDFKTTVLGGPVRAWLIELANPDEDEIKKYLESVAGWGQSRLLSYGSATTAFVVKFLFGLIIMVLALFAFLLDGPAMLDGLKRLSPLEDAYEDELISEFQNVSRAVVLATLFAALAQGVLGAIGYYLVGLEPVMLLMLLTTTLALVPFVGAAAVWIPCCLYLFFVDGRIGGAIFLAVYGIAVVSLADNIIKPLVLHGQSNLHPLLALLSVLGGVAALGPVGILVGPMVVAFLDTLLRILQRELTEIDEETERQPPGTGPPGEASSAAAKPSPNPSRESSAAESGPGKSGPGKSGQSE